MPDFKMRIVVSVIECRLRYYCSSIDNLMLTKYKVVVQSRQYLVM